MRQRTVLILTMGLTTFLLVIAAAVIGRLAVAPASGAEASTGSVTEQPTVQRLTDQQEADYQAALATANAQLEQANRQLEDAYRRLTPAASAAAPSITPVTALAGSLVPPSPAPSPPQPVASVPSSPSSPGQITAEQAVTAAQAYVGGGVVERVQLEEENGQLVYEVRFTNNSRVYVDPISGRVIYARLEGQNNTPDDDNEENDD